MLLWIFLLLFFFFSCPSSYFHLKNKISIYPLRNSFHLFWISRWSRIFATKGEGNREDDDAKDACFLLSVITMAERDNYSFRSFEVSLTCRIMMSLLIICVNELGDNLWISWILQGGLNWRRDRKDGVAWVLVLKWSLLAGNSSPWFPFSYSEIMVFTLHRVLEN